MIKIVGFQHKEGSFDDNNGRTIKYNSVLLFYVSDVIPEVVGRSVGELKIPFDSCKGITGYDYSLLPELIDKNVELSYIPLGKYQQLSSIRVVEDKK